MTYGKLIHPTLRNVEIHNTGIISQEKSCIVIQGSCAEQQNFLSCEA